MVNFSVFRLTKGADEMLFGQIIRDMVRSGYPMIDLRSSETFHEAVFLMQGTDLFTLTVRLKRYTGDFVLSRLTDIPIRIDLVGMAIVKGATFNHLLELYKTNIENVMRFPFLGQIKVHHDYNRIYVWGAIVGRGSKYFIGEDRVDTDRFFSDLSTCLDEILTALSRFISGRTELSYVDQSIDVDGTIDRLERDVVERIADQVTITVACPACGGRFDTPATEVVTCPHCKASGRLDLG